ncbi:SPW repeat protein [Rhizobium binxianense]
MNQRRWQDHAAFIIGMWLIASPWAFGSFSADSVPLGAAAWNFLACGAVVAILAVAALVSYRLWEEWFELLIGIWLIISPWMLGFTLQPIFVWNALICGCALLMLSLTVLGRGRFPAGNRRK